MNARAAPAEVFPPGTTLGEELEERGWSQLELAEILGRPPRLVSELIAGKRAITPETAKGLAAALGTSAEFWMNLETAYQLSKAKVDEDQVARRARLYEKFPVKELIKRGWIEASDNLVVVEQRFCEFFQINSLEDEPRFAHAARKRGYQETPVAQLAWLFRARQLARGIHADKYSKAALLNAIQELRGCLEYEEEISKVSIILAKAGVRLVIVEALTGAKIDGACFWIDGSPVVALSLQYDRIDNFWFNLFHELDHALHGEGKEQPIVETINLEALDGLPEIERRANDAAADCCIPAKEMEGFIARVNPMFSKAAIIGFARRVNVHPGLVVGQLHGRRLIPYQFNREFLVKVRSRVVEVVMTDGFGNRIAL